ncbi:MAG: LamG domain-containing protein [Verrucomicrobia bacterium]|nr:LamG domain-containing protein [Verrucomicrobiota bacterium]
MIRPLVITVALSLGLVGCGRSVEQPPARSQPSSADGLMLGLLFNTGIRNSGQAPLVTVNHGAGETREGRSGGAAAFSNDASIAIARLPMTTEGSWCVWFCPEADSLSGDARVMDANAFTIGISKGRLYAYFYDGEIIRLHGSELEPNVWTHVAMTWAKGYLKLYVDGVIFDQGAYADAPGAAVRDLRVGNRWTGSGKAFTGLIDDVLIYDRALSLVEIERLMTDLTLLSLETPPGSSPR